MRRCFSVCKGFPVACTGCCAGHPSQPCDTAGLSALHCLAGLASWLCCCCHSSSLRCAWCMKPTKCFLLSPFFPRVFCWTQQSDECSGTDQQPDRPGTLHQTGITVAETGSKYALTGSPGGYIPWSFFALLKPQKQFNFCFNCSIQSTCKGKYFK